MSTTYRCFINGDEVDSRKTWATPNHDRRNEKGDLIPTSSPNCIPAARGVYLARVVNHFDPSGQLIGTDDYYEAR